EHSFIFFPSLTVRDPVRFQTKAIDEISAKGAHRCFLLWFNATNFKSRSSCHARPGHLWRMLCLLVSPPRFTRQFYTAGGTLKQRLGFGIWILSNRGRNTP